MRNKIADKVRLIHISEAISDIEKITLGKSIDDMLNEPAIRFSVIKLIEIIGEASTAISSDTKDKFSEVEWLKMKAMRNILVHEYFGVDLEQVWEVVMKDIPLLKEQVLDMLETEWQ